MSPTVHIIPHTHWDREWYHSQARFGVRLARLVDDVLARLASGQVQAFLLDGQAILLDDYAALRKGGGQGDRGTGGQNDALREALASGQLESGPWYVLADNLTVSGEALVRNLLEGGRAVRRHGGKAMKIGYAPDAFGHPAILPTLFAGFGIETAVTWRGFGGGRGEEKDLYRWRGPDGAEVLMIHLPPPGYEYGANLPADAPAARRRWTRLRRMLESRARSDHWLVMNGADHHALQPDLSEALYALTQLDPECEFVVGSLSDYARAVRKRVQKASRRDALPLITGELRDGRRHAWALQGTFSSRVALKQRNAECQRLLERIAEPLASLVLAGSCGASAMHFDPRAELHAAWRTLLENHPHDSICGTSTDAVHREMEVRFARCRDQADELAQRALDAVIHHDADDAREAAHGQWTPSLVLFNPAPGERSAVVELEVERFVADDPVGPSSAHTPRTRATVPGPLVLRDARGRVVSTQLLGRSRTRTSLVESPHHYPDNDVVLVERVAVAASDLPPLGVSALTVHAAPFGARRRITGNVRAEGLELSNERLRARVEGGGMIAMARIGGGWNAHGLARLELMADAGDSYTSAPRGNDLAADPDVAGDVLHDGPLVGELRVWRDLSGELPQPWSLYQPLHARLLDGESFVRLTMAPQWLGAGLRLRMAFPLGERARRVVADGPFGPVARTPGVARKARSGETEATPATAPMQRYVSIAGARTGLTVFADGLQEYEARPDGTLLVTLERTFAEVSRRDLSERRGHASWPSHVRADAGARPPYRLAVMLHDPAELDRREEIEQAAEAFFAPPVGFMRRALLARPDEVRGPELSGAGLVFSAMKPAESGKGMVLRCYNARDEAVSGGWRLPWPVRSAARCRLDETPGERMTVDANGEIAFAAAAREVVTILVK